MAARTPEQVSSDPAQPTRDLGLAAFTKYFVKNYPGPDTIIHKPEWHAPKLYRAAIDAYRRAARSVPEAGKAVDETLTALSGFLVFLKDMRFTGSWDLPTLNRAIEVGETIAEQQAALASVPAPSGDEPAWGQAVRAATRESHASIYAVGAPQAVPAEDIAGLVERLNDIITDQRADQREYGGAAVNPDVLSEAAAALTSLSAERDALAKKVQAFRNDGLVQAAIARQGALQEELDEAREANRKLHRRVQKFEGAETSFRMSFASWAKVLFRAESTPERRPDFESWQREIDKEFASGRAEAAEARATASEAEASDLRRKLEERDEALKPFATFSDHKTSYVELPVRWCIAAARALAASPAAQTDGGGE